MHHQTVRSSMFTVWHWEMGWCTSGDRGRKLDVGIDDSFLFVVRATWRVLVGGVLRGTALLYLKLLRQTRRELT